MSICGWVAHSLKTYHFRRENGELPSKATRRFYYALMARVGFDLRHNTLLSLHIYIHTTFYIRFYVPKILC